MQTVVIKEWWPNGYGNQTLYDLFVFFTDSFGVMNNKKIRIGFRTVEIVQDYVSADKSLGNISSYTSLCTIDEWLRFIHTFVLYYYEEGCHSRVFVNSVFGSIYNSMHTLKQSGFRNFTFVILAKSDLNTFEIRIDNLSHSSWYEKQLSN